MGTLAGRFRGPCTKRTYAVSRSSRVVWVAKADAERMLAMRDGEGRPYWRRIV